MRILTIGAYLGFLLAGCVANQLARRDGARLPSAGDIVARLSARRLGRLTVMLAWWWVGWHFFVR